MKFSRILCAALVISPLMACAQPGVSQQSQQIPQIVTTGTGDAQVTPDRARIDITVETRGATAAAAAAENARISTAVRARIVALGIEDQRISTWGYNLQPEYDYNQRGDGRPRVIGYVARNTVRTDVHQVAQVGSVIDAALGAGANTIGGLDFYSSTMAEARKTALADAVQKARADAEVMANAAGGSLGELIELSSTYFGGPTPPPYMARMEASIAQADATPISPGERTINVTVNARWRFVSR
jgi:uncharacterized protein YggE